MAWRGHRSFPLPRYCRSHHRSFSGSWRGCRRHRSFHSESCTRIAPSFSSVYSIMSLSVSPPGPRSKEKSSPLGPRFHSYRSFPLQPLFEYRSRSLRPYPQADPSARNIVYSFSPSTSNTYLFLFARRLPGNPSSRMENIQRKQSFTYASQAASSL